MGRKAMSTNRYDYRDQIVTIIVMAFVAGMVAGYLITLTSL